MSTPNKFDELLTFQQKLGAQIETYATGIWSHRIVTGDRVSSYFYNLQSLELSERSPAVTQLKKLQRKHPQAKLWLITPLPPEEALRKKLADHGIRAATVWQYFNAILESDTLARKWIAAADEYIPQTRYVEQRVQGTDQKAADYVNNWLKDGEGSLLIVLAPAGHGKTCLALNLARVLSAAHLTDPRLAVPFYLPLHRHPHVRMFEEPSSPHYRMPGYSDGTVARWRT